jgi:hypothetical protein
MWKSASGWLRATRDPQETRPRVPHLFERLEPRLLLSVVFEVKVQPTDPATPEDYALYISENTQRVDPTPEQTRIFMVCDGTQTKARVTLVFPDSGYEVTNWGTVQRQDNTFSVNAEVTRWMDSPATVVTTLTHEYDLGTLAYADYVFEFRAWDQPVESREFRPGWEQFVEYVPTPEQTKLFITQDSTNTKANVSMLFSSSGYMVRDWGEVQQDGNTLYVDAELEKWTGAALCVMITETHAYDLGTLAPGDYVFEFRASGQLIKSREFRPGPDQYVQYNPTPEQTAIFIVPAGAPMKAEVTMVLPTDGYVVRSWGEVQRQGDNHFYVNAEVERWTGAVNPVSTTVTHEYDLGTLADGNYYFHFYAWDQHIETRDFQPGREQWVPYVPATEPTNILVMADGAGGTKARVTIVFNDMGYAVHDWGTVQQTGSTFSVNAEVEKWTGGAAATITPVSHDYDLGSLPDGNYVFQFNAWRQPVESREFVTPGALKPVFRFWSPVLSRHFYTLRMAERDKLIQNYSHVWTYEQVAYYAFAADTEPDTVPVYRFWSGTLNTHFYTANRAERDKLINSYSQAWAYEGVAFYTYPGGLGVERPIETHPVYRLWSGSLGSHFFTASDAEMNKVYGLTTRGWEWEGVAWYAYAPVILDRQPA